MLGQVGAFDVKHLELIDGELIDTRMGKNRPHILAVFLIQKWLESVFGDEHVQTESPIDVAGDDEERGGADDLAAELDDDHG